MILRNKRILLTTKEKYNINPYFLKWNYLFLKGNPGKKMPLKKKYQKTLFNFNWRKIQFILNSLHIFSKIVNSIPGWIISGHYRWNIKMLQKHFLTCQMPIITCTSTFCKHFFPPPIFIFHWIFLVHPYTHVSICR